MATCVSMSHFCQNDVWCNLRSARSRRLAARSEHKRMKTSHAVVWFRVNWSVKWQPVFTGALIHLSFEAYCFRQLHWLLSWVTQNPNQQISQLATNCLQCWPYVQVYFPFIFLSYFPNVFYNVCLKKGANTNILCSREWKCMFSDLLH